MKKAVLVFLSVAILGGSAVTALVASTNSEKVEIISKDETKKKKKKKEGKKEAKKECSPEMKKSCCKSQSSTI